MVFCTNDFSNISPCLSNKFFIFSCTRIEKERNIDIIQLQKQCYCFSWMLFFQRNFQRKKNVFIFVLFYVISLGVEMCVCVCVHKRRAENEKCNSITVKIFIIFCSVDGFMQFFFYYFLSHSPLSEKNNLGNNSLDVGQ